MFILQHVLVHLYPRPSGSFGVSMRYLAIIIINTDSDSDFFFTVKNGGTLTHTDVDFKKANYFFCDGMDDPWLNE